MAPAAEAAPPRKERPHPYARNGMKRGRMRNHPQWFPDGGDGRDIEELREMRDQKIAELLTLEYWRPYAVWWLSPKEWVPWFHLWKDVALFFYYGGIENAKTLSKEAPGAAAEAARRFRSLPGKVQAGVGAALALALAVAYTNPGAIVAAVRVLGSPVSFVWGIAWYLIRICWRIFLYFLFVLYWFSNLPFFIDRIPDEWDWIYWNNQRRFREFCYRYFGWKVVERGYAGTVQVLYPCPERDEDCRRRMRFHFHTTNVWLSQGLERIKRKQPKTIIMIGDRQFERWDELKGRVENPERNPKKSEVQLKEACGFKGTLEKVEVHNMAAHNVHADEWVLLKGFDFTVPRRDPWVIFMQFGHDDIMPPIIKKPQFVLDNVKKAVEKLKENRPTEDKDEAKKKGREARGHPLYLVLVSAYISPRSIEEEYADKIDEFNTMLKAYADAESMEDAGDVMYLDVNRSDPELGRGLLESDGSSKEGYKCVEEYFEEDWRFFDYFTEKAFDEVIVPRYARAIKGMTPPTDFDLNFHNPNNHKHSRR